VAKTGFNPLDRAVVEQAGGLHVELILVSRNRTTAQITRIHGPQQTAPLSRQHTGRHQIAHGVKYDAKRAQRKQRGLSGDRVMSLINSRFGGI
jgi:hypothetical protein